MRDERNREKKNININQCFFVLWLKGRTLEQTETETQQKTEHMK